MSRPFEARYPGPCAGCRYPITPGDLVTYVDDELVHEGCTPALEALVVVCSTCWLAKPCGCDDE